MAGSGAIDTVTESPTYRFGDICVDLSRLVVTRGGRPVDLEPKAFDVLRVLLLHRDRLVTKDELLAVVWPDTFVTPNVLTRAIAQLRKALGDDAQEARYIETATKRGYRFIGQLDGMAPGPSPDAAAAAEVRRRRRSWSPAILLLAGAAVVLALSAAWWWSSRVDAGRNSIGPAPRLARVTLRRGGNGSPTLSPDGSLVAYVSDQSGQLEIYVTGLTRGSREVALTTDGGQNVEPAWSPDGRWIAFHSQARGGIWVVSSAGGSPTMVIDEGSQPAWSPDNEWIVYSSSQGAMAGQGTLKVVRRDGTQVRALTQPGRPVGGHQYPAWSHSGKVVAFVVSNGLTSGAAWLVPAAGGTPVPVPTAEWAGKFVFSPDDRSVYFAAGPMVGRALFHLALDPETGAVRGTPTMIAPLPSGYLDGLSLAGTDTLAFGALRAESRLWRIDLKPDGSAGEPVAVTDDDVRASLPSYAPDGRRIVFLQAGAGVEPSTWVMDENGDHREPLLPEGSSGNPSWSSVGTDVLVQRDYTKPHEPLWLVDAVTHRARPLPGFPDAGVRSPRISPDGRSVAYWRLEPDGAMNTYVQGIDGSGLVRVTSDAEAINYPAWSPDGEWLAVEIKRSETTHVGIVSRHGGVVEPLTHDTGQSWPYSWSPDGEWIVFAGERRAVWNVWAVSRRTRETRQLTHFTSASGYVRYPAWSPLGNRIIFERQTPEGAVWTLKLR